jgi:thioesterase domain-containing protein
MDFAPGLATLSVEQAALLDALLAEAADDGARATDAATVPEAVLIQKGADRPPLFLIHGSGGRVLFLHVLARHLTASQPVYGIEAATGDGSTIGAAERCHLYADAIRAVQPHGPYRIGGYSAGCLIAFEIAALLDEVDFLLLIDPAPVPDPDRAGVPSERPTPHQRLARRFEIAMLAGVTPLSPEFAYIERVSRDLSDIARHFRAEPRNQHVHIIHGTRGAYVPSRETLQRWRDLAGHGLACAAVEADHFEIVRDPHAATTGRQIQSWLNTLEEPDSPAR